LNGDLSSQGPALISFGKFQSAFPYIKNFRHAIDVGAHVGLWARVFARCFARLTAFELSNIIAIALKERFVRGAVVK